MSEDDVRRGSEAMEGLRREATLSEAERAVIKQRILDGLDQPLVAVAAPLTPWRWAWAAAALVVVVGGAAIWWTGSRGRLALAWDDRPLSSWETLAVQEHGRLASPHAPEFVASDPAAVRSWVREHTGVTASLPVERPASDGSAFDLVGASAIERAGRKVGLIEYRVDGRPVTLLVARSADEPDAAPAWRPWRKALRARELPGHDRLLTWNSAGTVYSLAVDGDLALVRACFVCHTTPERRRVIEDADLH
jgi:hypothetical protein